MAGNAMTVAILTVAMLLLLVLVFYVGSELYQRRKRRKSDHCESTLCDTNKEIVVFFNDIPITLREILTPSGVYYRILDEYQATLITESSEPVGVIDRVERMFVGASDFEHNYGALLKKYEHAESLRGLQWSLAITIGTGGGGMLTGATSTGEIYAEAFLNEEGVLRLNSRNRRRMPMMSVKWLFPTHDEQQQQSNPWLSFGRVYDRDDTAVFELRLSAQKRHRYMLFHAPDEHGNQPSTPLLKIKGGAKPMAWATKGAGGCRTALAFSVYAADKDNHKVLVANIRSPIGAGGVTLTDLPGMSDQLMMIKYLASSVDSDLKSAVLSVALLLCLRHWMKDLYQVFERVAMSTPR